MYMLRKNMLIVQERIVSKLQQQHTGIRATNIDFITTALILFLTLIDFGHAIRCYRCEVTLEKYYENDTLLTTPMCLKFDRSKEFIIDCPYSTMCLKTISTFTLNNGQKSETVTRGCAQQKNTTQVFRNRSWQKQHSVQEVYPEGCEDNKGNNLVGASLTRCYCRGDLCNSSTTLHGNISFMFYIYTSMAVIMFCNAFFQTTFKPFNFL